MKTDIIIKEKGGIRRPYLNEIEALRDESSHSGNKTMTGQNGFPPRKTVARSTIDSKGKNG